MVPPTVITPIERLDRVRFGVFASVSYHGRFLWWAILIVGEPLVWENTIATKFDDRFSKK